MNALKRKEKKKKKHELNLKSRENFILRIQVIQLKILIFLIFT